MSENRKPSRKRSSPARGDDAPELTAEWFEGADLYRGKKLVSRGRPAGSGSKVLLSIRLDKDAVAAYRATGERWQSRINDAVVKAAQRLKGRGA